jgi:hypothetical protein
MRRARRTAVVAVLLMGLAALAAPAAEAAKPAKCKKGQVKERVKVRKGKVKTRCVKAKQAWPAPKPVDVRAVGTRYVLGQDYAKVRDRRGRRAKSLPKLLERIHPRADTALAAAAKAGLARMDARAAASQAGSGCGGGGTISSTFDAGGGQSVDMTMTGGSDASLQLGLESRQGDRRVRIEIEFPGCESTRLESCPTADGIVRGSDNRRIGIRAFVIEGGRETWSQGIRLEGETTLRGVVADDAKLDFFEPHNTEVGVLTLGGSSRGFSPLSMRMLVQRITRVDMRATPPSYQLGPSTLNVTITSPDLTGPAATATERQIESGMRSRADEQFRDIVDKAIRRMRATEEGWNSPNRCATIQFTPASGTRTLRVGDTGSVSANLVSSRGGSPSRASWTQVGAGNATFSPATATAVPASFSYSGIAQAGEGIFVTGAWKAVSKAGVAQETWTQPTVSSAINTISGTFSGDQDIGGSILSWAGEATFRRVFPGPGGDGAFQLQSASYTVTASGRALHIDCQQSGTKTVTETAGDLTSTGQPPDRAAPYDLSGSIIPVGPFNSTMTVSLSGCSGSNPPSSMVTSLAFTPLKLGGQSADGVDFSGNLTDTQGMVTNWRWSMRGTP